MDATENTLSDSIYVKFNVRQNQSMVLEIRNRLPVRRAVNYLEKDIRIFWAMNCSACCLRWWVPECVQLSKFFKTNSRDLCVLLSGNFTKQTTTTNTRECTYFCLQRRVPQFLSGVNILISCFRLKKNR